MIPFKSRTQPATGVLKRTPRDTLKVNFDEWLNHVISQPPPPGLVAFNFNIAEAFGKFQVSLIGATSYDPENLDWACAEAFVSQPRNFNLPHSEVGAQWQDVQRLVEAWVLDHIRRAPRSSPLREATAVTVGFVDGELAKVWAGRS